MDGAHDLGGREGFGPIDVNEPEVPFHADWEGRMWAISKTTGQPDWTIDWWRHVRELIDPVDYLSRPYFDSWAQTQIAAFIDSGVLTMGEAISGKAEGALHEPQPALTVDEAVAAVSSQATRFDQPVDAPPAFSVGQSVLTASAGHSGHTRLPQYARGRRGVIHAHHGAHIMPDKSAAGREEAEHLYSVAFAAQALWPEANRNDRVFLDLWESYLEPAG